MADFKLNVVIGGVEQSVSTIADLEKALRDTKEELRQVGIGSQEFERLGEQARVLQREFVNSYKETTIFNKNIAELTESTARLGSTITSAFTIATSAITLFGGESKDLTEDQAKAQQALAIALSATTIATNAKTIAEDINNVGLALQNGLTKTLTALLGAQTVATAAQAAATGTATIAQRALNVVMAANPIGLVVAAVTALVGAYLALSDSEQEVYKYQVDINDEIENNSKKIKENITNQKELAVLQGKIAETNAKTESEKLKIRLQTESQIGELDRKQLESDLDAANRKQTALEKEALAQAGFVKGQIGLAQNLQDFNVESRLTEEQKVIASLTRQKEQGILTVEEFNARVVDNYIKSFRTTDVERKKDFDSQLKTYNDLKTQRELLGKELANFDEVRKAQNALTQAEIQAQNEADRKKTADNLKKRKEEIESFNKDVVKLQEDAQARQRTLQRELEDFLADRISLVQGQGEEDKVFREDLIKNFDETIAKLKLARDRGIEDEKRAFDKSVQNFIDTEKKRVDQNNKRIVTDEQINAKVAELTTTFNTQQLQRAENVNQQITIIEQDKADKINEINTILNSELAFGDNNLADSRQQIALDTLNFQIQLKARELELEKGGIGARQLLFDEEANRRRVSQIQQLKELQNLQAQARAAEKAAILQRLQIERDEQIKNLQGTEEQKAEQKERLLKFYQSKEAQINSDFRLREKEAELKNLEDIQNARLSTLQKYTEIATNIANTILGVFQGVNELRKVELDNNLNALRDSTAQQTSVLNEEYNAQREALNAQLEQNLISREQYDSALSSLDKNLASSTKQLRDKQQAEEDRQRKAAFEREKKLKIAQAIIAGIQGAVQAFTGAFQLGPIAGPIVGGILAALVASTTAVQVAAIRKTQYDSGAPEITAVSTASPNTGGVDTGAGAVAQASSGGLTQFNQSLVGTPTVTSGTSGGTTTTGPTRVYVVESDITSAQQRVKVLENNSTFG